jgi:putative transcriptional regulator
MSKRAEFFIRGQDLLAEPYRYRASGLDYVFLLNGVTVQDTPYGAMVTIDNVHALHRAIGLRIVESAAPIVGAEFRFLRKHMGLSQRELASLMRTSDQTVANYEKRRTEPGPADAFMRIAYLLHIEPGERVPENVVKSLSERLRTGEGAWLPAPARRKIVRNWREGRVAA